MNRSLFDKAWRWLVDVEKVVFPSDTRELKKHYYGTGRVVDILVIDVSPSMEEKDYPPSRLKGAKKAAARFLDKRLATNPDALVGIVKYGGRAKVVSHPLILRQHISELQESLEDMTTIGATNIAAGLRLASREIEEIPDAGHPRILLLTDGHYNTGYDPRDLAKSLKNQGVQIDIIGIGGSPRDVNERELKEMASVVDGELRYWFIKSVNELVTKFEALALREVR